MLSRLDLIPVSSPEWNLRLQPAEHDFFHRQEYHRLWAASGREAFLAVYGSRERFIAWPYIIDDVDGAPGARDVNSVYGYAGPIGYGEISDSGFCCDAWQALLRTWESQRVISVFTRFHPLLRNQRLFDRADASLLKPSEGVRGHGQTVAINLKQSETQIWSGYERKLRQKLHKCVAEGLVSRPDPQWTHLGDFARLYAETMIRNGAAPFYFFSVEYFLKLKEALGRHGTLLITTLGDRVVAAGIVIVYGQIGHLYLSGSDDEFGRLSPSKLMTHDSALWARARGATWLHMGGGRGNANDTLYAFKAAFSSDRFNFYTGRWILEADRYDALTVQRQCHRNRGELMPDYFPAYRAPYREPFNKGLLDTSPNAVSSSKVG